MRDVLQRKIWTGRDGMVTADVLLVATVVSFLAVVLAFGWWRARQVEPPARASGALGGTVAMALSERSAVYLGSLFFVDESPL